VRKGFRSIQKVRRGIRSHGSLGWYTGRNKGVRREYRSHRRLGDAFGDCKVTIGLGVNRKLGENTVLSEGEERIQMHSKDEERNQAPYRR
jgi:hypothetical protein